MKNLLLGKGTSFFFRIILCFFVAQLWGVGIGDLDPADVGVDLSFKRDGGRYNDFMRYNSTPEEYLNVSMRTNETLHFGFQFFAGNVGAPDLITDSVWVRVRDENNNIVFGPVEIRVGSQGYINNRDEAVTGPAGLTAGGYNALTYTAPADGDYHIQVAYSTDGGITDESDNQGWQSFRAPLYDFTVTDAGNNVQTGRVWSQAWHIINSVGWAAGLTCIQYIYTNDGIISALDYNNLSPYQYVIVSNSTGVFNTGDLVNDRRSIDSQLGAELIPEYKLFFDIPDTTLFPVANLDTLFGELNQDITVSGCPGDYCINIDVNRVSSANLLIDINGVDGFQANTEDLILEVELDSGINCVQWDGLDGLGDVVNAASITIDIEFLAGITHLPMYDTELNDDGIIVEFILPASIAGETEIYWDDTNVGGTVNIDQGCTGGCHDWVTLGNPTTGFGDVRIINSWWYIEKDPISSTIAISTYSFDLEDQTICKGDSVVITGPDAMTSYSWTPDDILEPDNEQTITSFPDTTTQLFIAVTDTFGCDYIDSLIVNVNQPPIAEIDSVPPVCTGTTVTLQASGGTIYRWFGNTNGLSSTNTSNPQTTPNDTILYSVEVTDANGCIDSTEVEIIVNEQASGSITSVDPLCAGESVQLQAAGGSQFEWINNTVGLSATNISDPVADPVLSTTYTVIVSNGSPICTDTVSIDIVVNEQPVAAIDPIDPICDGETIQLLASGGTDYLWFGNTAGLSSATIANPISTPGDTIIYQVEVSFGTRCKDTAEVEIIVNDQPVANANPVNPICAGESLQLQASGGTIYEWFGNVNGLSATNISDPVANPTDTVLYRVAVSLGTFCADTADVEVIVNAQPLAAIDVIDPVCLGESVQLQASGGTVYQWIGTTTGLSSVNIADPLATPIVSTTYEVEVSFGTFCKDTTTIEVEVNALPVASITPVDPICFGETTGLFASGGTSYRWFGDTTGLSSTNIPNPNVDVATTTTYQVEVRNDDGCVDQTSITVVVNQLPELIVSDSAFICLSESTVLNASGANSYLWTPGTSLSSTTGASVTASPTISTEYQVTGTDANGCQDSDTVFVTVFNNLIPSVTIAGEDVCEGEIINFRIVASMHLGDNPTYEWGIISGATGTTTVSGNGSSFSTNQMVSGDGVILTVTSNADCLAPGGATVTSNQVNPVISRFPDLQTSGNVSICLNLNESSVVSVSDLRGLATSFNWFRYPVDTLYASPNASFVANAANQAGFYYASASNNGCVSYSDTLEVSVVSVAVRATASEDLIRFGETVTLFGQTNGDQYFWTSDQTGTTVISTELEFDDDPIQTTIYTIRASIGDCFATDTVRVRVIPPYEAPYFFSPNGDGNNDSWIVKNINEYDEYTITIYNRWGNVIRRYNNDFSSWDGNNEGGTRVPDGVYYYVIQTDIKGEPLELSGYVTVSR